MGQAGERVSKQLIHADGSRHRNPRSWRGWSPDPKWGTYGTADLVRAARRAARRGWDTQKIAKRIYAPFILMGPATWSDSWGAPRFVGGYHPHHGQDVLCRYGAPVLAVESGTVQYGTDPLGGRYAFLIRDDGSYWYYAHLRSYAPDLSDGDHVTVGKIIGRCGASGDASVPHVHFCFFMADGTAVDPMPALVGWLKTAEKNLRHPHARHTAASDPVVLPMWHPTARAGSAGLAMPLPPVAETVEPALGTPRQRALSTAAFMMLFGSALWAVPARKRGVHRPEPDPGSVG